MQPSSLRQVFKDQMGGMAEQITNYYLGNASNPPTPSAYQNIRSVSDSTLSVLFDTLSVPVKTGFLLLSITTEYKYRLQSQTSKEYKYKLYSSTMLCRLNFYLCAGIPNSYCSEKFHRCYLPRYYVGT